MACPGQFLLIMIYYYQISHKIIEIKHQIIKQTTTKVRIVESRESKIHKDAGHTYNNTQHWSICSCLLLCLHVDVPPANLQYKGQRFVKELMLGMVKSDWPHERLAKMVWWHNSLVWCTLAEAVRLVMDWKDQRKIISFSSAHGHEFKWKM